MAQTITTTSNTRLCKRVIFEHTHHTYSTRTVQSVFLVPIDAKENELEFEFNDGDTELRYRVGAKGPGTTTHKMHSSAITHMHHASVDTPHTTQCPRRETSAAPASYA